MQNEQCKSCYAATEVVPVQVRDAFGQPWRDSTLRRCANDDCWDMKEGSRADRLLWIRNVYDYKYFGDYELTPEQRSAVDEAFAIALTRSVADPADIDKPEPLWRCEIKYGPEGEADYAWVYRGRDVVATVKTHYAKAICDRMNTPSVADPAEAVQPVGGAVLNWVNGEARSAIGDLYEVASLSGSVWQVRWNGTAFTGWHATRDEARAAAQADYERRILSALIVAEIERLDRAATKEG